MHTRRPGLRSVAALAGIVPLALGLTLALGTIRSSARAMLGDAPGFAYLAPEDFLAPRLLAPPPGAGSPLEMLELARIHALIRGATPARLAQAKWDAEHMDTRAFDATVAHEISRLPATSALLAIIMREVGAAVGPAKDAFGRARPYAVDRTIVPCTGPRAPSADDRRSYPSGHAAIGYAIGWTLARLSPERAPAILTRARDYAQSRELCGMHFASDTQAGQVLATLIADRLLADPRLAGRVAAAKAEWAALDQQADPADLGRLIVPGQAGPTAATLGRRPNH